MKLFDFDYNLPKELIAQYPNEVRDSSRLMVLDRNTCKIEHRIFKDIVEYFNKGDLLVLNDTKVVPARLTGHKETGGRIEALILYNTQLRRTGGEFEVLLKPSRGCGPGRKLIFGNGELKAVVTRVSSGRRFLRFEYNGDFEKLLDKLGRMPLPPYIKREEELSDKKRYQTIFASKRGAIAAPTAGLHFTRDILSRISHKEVDVEYLTLHVGYGTFKPVRCEDIARHRMEKEYFEVEDEVVEKLRDRKKRVIAVGTTTCRTLETMFSGRPQKKLAAGQHAYCGWSDLFIYPPYKFNRVDALLTNFHLPKTTLLMLVGAFCGRGLLFKAYREAIEKKYRFYSYGDAMLII